MSCGTASIQKENHSTSKQKSRNSRFQKLAKVTLIFKELRKPVRPYGMTVKQIENFRVDYPGNAIIDELQAEFEYQRLEVRINDSFFTYESDRHKKHIQMYNA